MILEKDILLVGRTRKPHGIRGEIVLSFQKTGYAELDTDFYFLEMYGIPVPYFVEEFISTTDVDARVKFEDVDDEKGAARLVDKRVFLPRERVKAVHDQDKDDWSYFIGFDVVDQHGKHLGRIREVDDSTINVLFIVAREEDEEYLIPAAEDFMIAIDEEKGLLKMRLPEGLLDG